MGDLNDSFERARNGSDRDQNELFELLTVRFRFLAGLYIGDERDAEDVVQKAVKIVFSKYKREVIRTSFSAWVWGVLRNEIRHHYESKHFKRNRSAVEISAAQSANLSVNPPDHELKQQLLQCLGKLIREYPQCARVLNLVHLGYKTEEVCRRLEISPSNMYVTLHRARTLLRKCLETGEF